MRQHRWCSTSGWRGTSALPPATRIDVDYYLWDASQGLTTHTASFRVAAVIPIAGFAADRGLVPEYPGHHRGEASV